MYLFRCAGAYNTSICMNIYIHVYVCVYAQKPAESIQSLSIPVFTIPLRQKLSLNLGLLFSWLDVKSASIMDLLVSDSLRAELGLLVCVRCLAC